MSEEDKKSNRVFDFSSLYEDNGGNQCISMADHLSDVNMPRYIEECKNDSNPYRLGDIFKFCTSKQHGINDKYISHHRGTIGHRYYELAKRDSDIDAFMIVVREKLEANPEKYKVMHDKICMHLRLGDCLLKLTSSTGHTDKFPTHPQILARILNGLGFYDINLFVGYHLAKEVISERYVNSLISSLKYKMQLQSKDNTPDDDFLYMISSKLFIKGRGGFSDLIQLVRNEMKLETKEIPGIVSGTDNIIILKSGETIPRHLTKKKLLYAHWQAGVSCIDVTNIVRYNFESQINGELLGHIGQEDQRELFLYYDMSVDMDIKDTEFTVLKFREHDNQIISHNALYEKDMLSARFGANDIYMDVTYLVRTLLIQKKDFKVDSTVLGRKLLPGIVKELVIYMKNSS